MSAISGLYCKLWQSNNRLKSWIICTDVVHVVHSLAEQCGSAAVRSTGSDGIRTVKVVTGKIEDDQNMELIPKYQAKKLSSKGLARWGMEIMALT